MAVGPGTRRCIGGFTLVEALLAVAILGFSAVAVSAALIGALQNVNFQEEQIQKAWLARGKVEELLAADFDDLTSGSDQVTIRGQTVQRSWSVADFDVDGGGIPDSDAKLVTVTVGDWTLETLTVDSASEFTTKR